MLGPNAVAYSYTLNGQNFSGTAASFESYVDDRTTNVAAISDLLNAFSHYLTDCQFAASPCVGGETLTTRVQGFTTNYALFGSSLNSNSTSGMIPDPLSSLGGHPGPSWYSWSPIDATHVATNMASEVESHTDIFNGVLLAPLHVATEWLPSFVLNPKPGVPGAKSYTCSPTGGCH